MFSFLFPNFSVNFLFSTTTYVGSFRDDYVFSSFRNDNISTGDGDDYVSSGRGRDVIDAGAGNDVVFAGRGRDTVNGGDGDDFIDGGRGRDILNGGAGNDIMNGGRGNDIMNGGAGDDVLNGGRGNDTMIFTASADAGNDVFNGGRGNDTLVLELTETQQNDPDIQADLAAYDAYVAGGSNGSFVFENLGLTITGGFENLTVETVIDPNEPTNEAPTVSGPVALIDGTEDTSSDFTVEELLANVTDADGDALSITEISASTGSIGLNEDGGYTYTPDADANGPVTLTYTVSDGTDTIEATATFDVIPVNDAPVISANHDLSDIIEDLPRYIILNARLLDNVTDAEQDTLVISDLVSSSGTLVLSDLGRSYEYTPDADFNGPVTLTYTVSDGVNEPVQASASFEVVPANDAPVVTFVDLGTIDEDNSTEFPSSAFLIAASDVDGDDLSLVDVRLIDPEQGSISFGDFGPQFTSAPDLNGRVLFEFDVSDGTVIVSSVAALAVNAINDGPDAGAIVELPIIVEEETAFISAEQLLANASDVEGDALEITEIGVSSGSIEADGPSGYVYTPNENFNGEVTFTYTISDGTDSASTTATMEIAAVNDRPDAGAPVNLGAIDEDDFLYFNVTDLLANASDVDGDALEVSEVEVSNGRVLDLGDGEFEFIPVPDDDGEVIFTFNISDGTETVQGSATLDLTPINDAPEFYIGSTVASGDEDTVINGQVSAIDAEGDLVTFSVPMFIPEEGGEIPVLVENGPANGSLELNAETGAFVYTPEANFNGTDSFVVLATDGNGGFTEQTVTIDVASVNDLPEFAEIGSYSISVPSNETGTGSLFATDLETASEDLVFSRQFSETPTFGSVEVNADGSYVYTPPAGLIDEITGEIVPFVGTDSFDIQVVDADGGIDIATVTVDVTAPSSEFNVIDGNANGASFFDVTGTSAADLFTFRNDGDGTASGADILRDFTSGTDLIEISGPASYTLESILATEQINFQFEELLYEYRIAEGLGGDEEAIILSEVQLTVDDLTGGGTIVAPGTGSNGQATPRDDILTGTALDDFIDGLAGDDEISGLEGDDILIGGDGNDILTGGDGNDQFDIFGNSDFLTVDTDTITDFVSGEDTIVLSGPPFIRTGGNENPDGTFTYQFLDGNTEQLRAELIVNVQLTNSDFGPGTGGPGELNVIEGTDEDDELLGTEGRDSIDGYLGNDIMLGLGGDDDLDGWEGDDTYTGGAGNDVFYFYGDEAGNNTITDFTSGEDRLALFGEDGPADLNAFLASVFDNGDGTFAYSLSADTTINVGTELTLNDIQPEIDIVEPPIDVLI